MSRTVARAPGARRVMLVRAAVLASIGLGASFACAPIEGSSLSQGPMNACPEFRCELYTAPKGATGFSKATCNAGRCEASVGMPSYAAAIVVDVPDTSFYAPGRTFVLTRDEVVTASDTGSRACVPPRCVQLPVLVQGVGHYRVTTKAAADVGFPQRVPEGTPIPYRVSFERLFGSGSDNVRALGLPVDPLFTSARLVRRPAEIDVTYSNAVPVGRYRRFAMPEPPYDAYFPPIETTLPVGDSFIDDVLLGDETTPLDDPTGDFRTAKIKRDDGLDGFHVWLADGSTDRRISTVRALSGASSTVRLDTVNQKQPGGTTPAIREKVVIVVAPPDGSLGIPTLRTTLLPTSTNLGEIEVPPLPEPVAASGVVAVTDDLSGALAGVPSRVTFTSNGILPKNASRPTTFLTYQASVSTDGNGRFATVLPPGSYEITLEPAEGTGRAKVRVPQTLELLAAKRDLVLRPTQLRTPVEGQVKLTDEPPRSVADAEVRALPKTSTTSLLPRPGRARTDSDGRFRMDLDPGQYDIVVDPQAGTGFPRVVTQTTVQATPVQLGTIQVPPPVRVSMTFRDPNPNLAGNPIVRATVRVFAQRVSPKPGDTLVEIGRAMTNETGSCEILLAQQPP
ncbi:MAG: hypothetical protein JST00_07915 [Deltaproteobacteria bacterium]|nr:hypothetical protein [Deltaproteobacteria bacterium]